jgi:hypothetical protein
MRIEFVDCIFADFRGRKYKEEMGMENGEGKRENGKWRRENGECRSMSRFA